MSTKKTYTLYTPAQRAKLLRRIALKIENGKQVTQACREVGVALKSYYNWLKSVPVSRPAQQMSPDKAALAAQEREIAASARAHEELAATSPAFADALHVRTRAHSEEIIRLKGENEALWNFIRAGIISGAFHVVPGFPATQWAKP